MIYRIRNLVFEGGGVLGIAYLGVLDYLYENNIIYWASQNGYVDILNWFKNLEFKYTNWAIDHASQNGYIEILDWFKNSLDVLRLTKLKYTVNAINCASEYGYIEILDWFKNSDL